MPSKLHRASAEDSKASASTYDNIALVDMQGKGVNEYLNCQNSKLSASNSLLMKSKQSGMSLNESMGILKR